MREEKWWLASAAAALDSTLVAALVSALALSALALLSALAALSGLALSLHVIVLSTGALLAALLLALSATLVVFVRHVVSEYLRVSERLWSGRVTRVRQMRTQGPQSLWKGA